MSPNDSNPSVDVPTEASHHDDTGEGRVSANEDSGLWKESQMLAAEETVIDEEEWIGTVIDNRYRVEGLIGSGGMAAVFAAEHVRLGHRVAVKVLLPEYQGHDEVRARFAREALAMARLDHPHIATAHDYGELDNGGRYMVMPLVPGESLRDMLHHRDYIPWREACAIGAQVADALAEAHLAQVVHRDLKPDNIMVATRDDGGVRATILDFGIARVRSLDSQDPERASKLRTLTRIGHVMGTPGYMAPEQATGAPVDERTDIYSLGLVLWEMMAGESRFEDEKFADILERQLTESTPPLRGFEGQEDLPIALDQLIERMLHPKGHGRPENASDIRDQLLGYAYSDAVDTKSEPAGPMDEAALQRALKPARAPSMFDTITPQKQGKGWVFAVLAMALAVGVGGFAAGRFAPRLGLTLDEGQVPEELAGAVETMMNSESSNDRRDAARLVLGHEPREEIPDWAEAAAQLTYARTCETRSSAIARIVELGDRRARPPLDYIDTAPRRGCGRSNRADCYACNRREVRAALQVLSGVVPEPEDAGPEAEEEDAGAADEADAGTGAGG